MRGFEAIIFMGLAASLHLAMWTQTAPVSGASGSGSVGADQVTLAAASPVQAKQIAEWQRPPEAKHHAPSAMISPLTEGQSPRLATPDKAPPRPAPAPLRPTTSLDTSALAKPQLDVTPHRLQKSELAQTRPQARPENLVGTVAEAAAQSRSRQVAKGDAGSQQQGRDGAAASNSAQTARANALRAAWGAAIHAKVQRSMRYPSNAKAEGTAKLALQIAANGTLRDMRLTRSSGNALLDKAALHAVSRAGRFARAPKGLPGDVHGFSLSLTFTQ